MGFMKSCGFVPLQPDTSMPEIVAGLVMLSRDYKDELQQEGNSEAQGWGEWETALSQALIGAAGQDEFDDLVPPR